MRIVELTPRLRPVAELVPRGARFVNVGTDRTYLPAWLLQQGRIIGTVASDLRSGPLERARGMAEKYSLTGRMDFRLCDELSGVQPDEVDIVAIAGMGGEIIAVILTAAPWTWRRECLLLLQPMSAQPFLRHWFQTHSYIIRRELLSREGGVLYTTSEMYVDPMAELTLVELQAGRQARGGGPSLRLAYLDRPLRQTERAIARLERSKRPEDTSRLAELEQVHQELLDTKEERLSWQR